MLLGLLKSLAKTTKCTLKRTCDKSYSHR